MIVGAVAYQIHFSDDEIRTGDIDFAIAMDLVHFEKLAGELSALDWVPLANREERWRSRRRVAAFDPGRHGTSRGQALHQPRSQSTMSLVGFDHVFAEARLESIGYNLTLRVIPPAVLMLLKIVAFLDDPYNRSKDLYHVRALLSK